MIKRRKASKLPVQINEDGDTNISKNNTLVRYLHYLKILLLAIEIKTNSRSCTYRMLMRKQNTIYPKK